MAAARQPRVLDVFVTPARTAIIHLTNQSFNGDKMATEQPVLPDKSRLRLSRSTIFPLVGGRSAWAQEHLLPIAATVLVGLALIVALQPGQQQSAADEINQAWLIYWILAIYIAFLVNCYVTELCGRAKRWWLIGGVALFTALLVGSPLWKHWYSLFYNVIPGTQWHKSSNSAVQLAGWLMTGLCEEGFKALPVGALAILGAGLGVLSGHTQGRTSRLLAGLGRRIGVTEPLDGIVLGAASGSGFFITETLGQYVPGTISQVKDVGTQAFDGLVLLLGRGLPDVAEHSAWTGLFGYFIGLAVLRPGMAIYLLPLGWLSAAALHAGWDGIDAVTSSGFVILGFWLFLGVFSYALLAGAIFKAREISPTLACKSASPDDVRAPAALAPATAATSGSDDPQWD
jgi:RsiW-degrading membrane proteinase PrsW (M82 family)